jgi:hypothetical protein
MRIVFSLILLTFSIQSFGQTLKNCSICSNQIIKNEQLKNLSIDELRFLTNDLFARKGYKLKVQMLTIIIQTLIGTNLFLTMKK